MSCLPPCRVEFSMVKFFIDSSHRFLGEVFPQPKSFASFPFSPSMMPTTPTSNHVYLVIIDYVANTFLYSAKAKGIANQTFSASDDDVVKDLLREYFRCDQNFWMRLASLLEGVSVRPSVPC